MNGPRAGGAGGGGTGLACTSVCGISANNEDTSDGTDVSEVTGPQQLRCLFRKVRSVCPSPNRGADRVRWECTRRAEGKSLRSERVGGVDRRIWQGLAL